MNGSPDARKPASLASFRHTDPRVIELLLQLLDQGQQPQQPQPEPMAPQESQPNGLFNLLQMLMTQ